MNIRDGYNSKKVVTFDMQDRLDDKIDKLTSMISKLTAQGSNENKQFKPKIYQGKRRGQTRKYYDQGNYQNTYRSNSEERRKSIRGKAPNGQNERGRSQYVNNRMTLGEKILEEQKIIEVKILQVDIEVIIVMITLEEVEVDLGRDNIQVILDGMIEVGVVDQDQV